MIALYENILQNYDTLTMTNEDANYPVTNIFSTYGTLRAQTTGETCLLTIDFAQDQSADCFFLAFSNLLSGSTILVNYYDFSLALLYTDNLVKEDYYIVKSYFEKLTTIRTIEITITNALYAEFYFGTIWIGEKFKLPDIEVKPIWGGKNFAGYQKSTSGHVSGQIKGLYDKWQVNFPIIDDYQTYLAIKNYFNAINNLPHIIDFYEDIDNYVFYCHVINNEFNSIKQNDNNFRFRDINITYEECF